TARQSTQSAGGYRPQWRYTPDCQQRYSRSVPYGKGDKQSPGHPNSMQEHKAEAIRRRNGEEDPQGAPQKACDPQRIRIPTIPQKSTYGKGYGALFGAMQFSVVGYFGKPPVL